MVEDDGYPGDDNASASADVPADATYSLLDRAKGGDREALEIRASLSVPTNVVARPREAIDTA
jgi:hypothetical protein